MKFEKIEPGIELYDCHSQKMGNTNVRTLGVWVVKVLEVDAEKRRALVSWNGNRATWWFEHQLSKLKKDRPILIRSAFGSYRRATKEEIAEMAKSGEQA